jgi:hypothetical protein
MKKFDLLRKIDDLMNEAVSGLLKVPMKAYYGFNGRLIEYRFCFIRLVSKKSDNSHFSTLYRFILN